MGDQWKEDVPLFEKDGAVQRENRFEKDDNETDFSEERDWNK